MDHLSQTQLSHTVDVSFLVWPSTAWIYHIFLAISSHLRNKLRSVGSLKATRRYKHFVQLFAAIVGEDQINVELNGWVFPIGSCRLLKSHSNSQQ